jgi:probable DNA metabolism protein
MPPTSPHHHIAQIIAREEHTGALLACDATLEGVLTATGMGYLAHADPTMLRLAPREGAQPRLGETVIDVATDYELASRVWRGFQAHVSPGCRASSQEACQHGCADVCGRHAALVAASDDTAMPEVLHRYLRAGFDLGPALRLHSADPEVAQALDLARSVSAECEHMRQFARFSHMADGLFLATIRPTADVLPFVAGYFTARLGTERFCVVDPGHRVAALHEAGGRTALVALGQADAQELASRDDLDPDEHYVRAMWKRLYDGLALPGRDRTHRGYDLRRQYLPQHLWTLLPELDPRNDHPGPYVPARYSGDARNGTSYPLATLSSDT